MKKLIVVLLIGILMTAFAAAAASASGTGLVIIPEEMPAEEQAQTAEFLKENAAIRYFPEDVQGQIAGMMAEGADVSSLQLFEMKNVVIRNAKDALGKNDALSVIFTFEVAFDPNQTIIVLAGADGEWRILDTQVLEYGSLETVIPKDVLNALDQAQEAKLVVLGTSIW
ncbi:MAG: hypothetical protein J5564_00780 [Clostridia bacterium]|nr:hypothetical protein [Clostridia bacterium]